MSFREKYLSNPGIFGLFKFLIGVNDRTNQIISDYVQTSNGEIVVDIACGNGDYSRKLKGVSYLGIDMNPGYIDYAKKNYSKFGDFVCADVAQLNSVLAGRKIDVVLLIGVLHHLTDSQATMMLGEIACCLSENGRVVSVDGVFTPDQGLVARLLAAADRGKYVRLVDDHNRILEKHLVISRSEIREDWLRIPYTHYVCVSRKRVETDI
jgi:ubiquinone/menaquinone biosynthesis C-methylase UbiE